MKLLEAVVGAAALIALSVVPAVAQAVRGQLVERASQLPIRGGFLTLVDEQGRELARALTDRAGQFLLRAPAPGT